MNILTLYISTVNSHPLISVKCMFIQSVSSWKCIFLFEFINLLLLLQMVLLQGCDLNESWEKFKALTLTANAEINSFHVVLENIEKKRVQKTKVSFKKYYQLLHNIQYMLPCDLQKLFEDKMQVRSSVKVCNCTIICVVM